MSDYASLDATALAERVRRGEVHPRELVETAIAAIEKVNPALNAVVHRMYEQGRAAAAGVLPAGPFRGVPFVVKDLDGAVAGEPYTMSCRLLASYVPGYDGEIIARMRRTGVVLVAKTNTPEFGLLAVTEPELRGPARNPWDPQRTPGGSSGGSAALVAARAVPMAHGGDGGGSIRIPAAACGLFGLKPTRARNPVGPERTEVWGGYVQPHVLTRSVRDSAVMLEATRGPESGAPYVAPEPERPYPDEVSAPPGRLRVAFSAASLYGRSVHADNAAAVMDVARLCGDLGHEVVEEAPPFDRDEAVHAFFVQLAAGAATSIEDAGRLAGRRGRPRDFEAPTWMLGQIGRKLSALDLERSRHVSLRLGTVLARFFTRHDVFLCPTLAHPPVLVGALSPRRLERAGLAFLRAVPAKRLLDRVLAELGAQHLERTANTMLFNQTGVPAMNVPLCADATGFPVGVQFAARFGDEATLFRLAAQLEQARPWIQRRPPICA